MTVSRGLTEIAFPDLEALLQNLEHQRLRCPLTATSLLANGLDHLTPHLDGLMNLEAPAFEAALRLVIAERRFRPVPRIELVWTGPEASVSPARDTRVVVRELFESATKTVVIGGYSFTTGEDIFAPLHEGMVERGVHTTMFLDIDDTAPSADKVEVFARSAIDEFLSQNWPFGEPYPEIYYDPRTVTPRGKVSLHAKCVVVDEVRCLVTSANFTFSGQQRNIEMGVLIEDGRLASHLVQQWRGLIEAGLVLQA